MNVSLSFVPQTLQAPWAARYAGTVEQLSIAVTANGVSYPAGSFVLHGGQNAFDVEWGALFNDGQPATDAAPSTAARSL